MTTNLSCSCSLDGRCPRHGAMVAVLHTLYFEGGDEMAETIYALSDGYGIVGYVPPQGYDWSGIRDSSTEAVEAMFDAAVALAERAYTLRLLASAN